MLCRHLPTTDTGRQVVGISADRRGNYQEGGRQSQANVGQACRQGGTTGFCEPETAKRDGGIFSLVRQILKFNEDARRVG